MNFLHLKYAVEIERTGSISKAAKKLYMAQPNLSQAMKDLEQKLGFKIFRRTSRGVVPTHEGIKFLNYARTIVEQMDYLETEYARECREKDHLIISSERITYVSTILANTLNELGQACPAVLEFNETETMSVIEDVVKESADLGIIRCQESCLPALENMLQQKELTYEEIWNYSLYLMVSQKSPLATYTEAPFEHLADYIEIVHGDYKVPLCPFLNPYDISDAHKSGRRIYVYDRGSKINLLQHIPDAYIWSPPISADILNMYSLVQMPSGDTHLRHKDIVIYKQNKQLTAVESLFIEKLAAMPKA